MWSRACRRSSGRAGGGDGRACLDLDGAVAAGAVDEFTDGPGGPVLDPAADSDGEPQLWLYRHMALMCTSDPACVRKRRQGVKRAGGAGYTTPAVTGARRLRPPDAGSGRRSRARNLWCHVSLPRAGTFSTRSPSSPDNGSEARPGRAKTPRFHCRNERNIPLAGWSAGAGERRAPAGACPRRRRRPPDPVG
jgi:hypothetical protein